MNDHLWVGLPDGAGVLQNRERVLHTSTFVSGGVSKKTLRDRPGWLGGFTITLRDLRECKTCHGRAPGACVKKNRFFSDQRPRAPLRQLLRRTLQSS